MAKAWRRIKNSPSSPKGHMICHVSSSKSFFIMVLLKHVYPPNTPWKCIWPSHFLTSWSKSEKFLPSLHSRNVVRFKDKRNKKEEWWRRKEEEEKEEEELSLKLDPLAALEDPISTSTFRQQQHPMVESNRLSVKNTMSLERQRAKNEGVLFLWLSSEFILTWRSSWGRPADGENCHGAATSRTWAVKGAPTELSPEMISKCMCRHISHYKITKWSLE